MKKILVICLSMILVFCFCSCGSEPAAQNNGAATQNTVADEDTTIITFSDGLFEAKIPNAWDPTISDSKLSVMAYPSENADALDTFFATGLEAEKDAGNGAKEVLTYYANIWLRMITVICPTA